MTHLDIVEQQYDLQPPDTTSAEGILAFTVRVCQAVPPAERWGLHEKPAGENIAYYSPAGKMVGISRLMQPDGSLVKILTDAGVGGTNRPAWNAEEPIDPERYVAVTGGSQPPDPPDPPDADDLEARVAALEAQQDKTSDDIKVLLALNAALEQRVIALEQAPAYQLPELIAVGSTGRTLAHGHQVSIPVRPK